MKICSRNHFLPLLCVTIMGCGNTNSQDTTIADVRFQDRIANEFGKQRGKHNMAERERAKLSVAIITNKQEINKNKFNIEAVDKDKHEKIKLLQMQFEEKLKEQHRKLEMELKRREQEIKKEMREQMERELSRRLNEKFKNKERESKSASPLVIPPHPRRLEDGTFLLGPVDALTHIDERILRLARLEDALEKLRIEYQRERDVYKEYPNLPQYSGESRHNYLVIANYCKKSMATIKDRKQVLIGKRSDAERLLQTSPNDLVIVPPQLQLNRPPRVYAKPRRN